MASEPLSRLTDRVLSFHLHENEGVLLELFRQIAGIGWRTNHNLSTRGYSSPQLNHGALAQANLRDGAALSF